MKIIFATQNQGKIEEMRKILDDPEIDVLSAEEAGVLEDVVEDGETFAENARKKASFVAAQTGHFAVADDSGLCIKALGGLPGVFSARWAGEGASAEALVQLTLEKLADTSLGQREAYFESAAVLCAPDGRHWAFSGIIEGKISKEPRGEPRLKLPYDVIFIPKGFSKTFAEMSNEEKNSLSHRGLAFRQLKEYIKTINRA